MNRDKLVRDWSRGVVLIVLWAGVGCARSKDVGEGGTAGQTGGAGVQGGGSPLASIQIRAAIEDETTNAGQGPFKVSYTGFAGTLDETRLGELSGHLSLRTWPEGTVVPTVVTIGPLASANNNVPDSTADVEITPSAALEDRWYSLQFGPAQSGVTTSQSFDGGVPGIRLRPGSHPAVRLIDFCQAAAPGSKFIVAFSEPVTAESPELLFTVTQNGTALSCRFDSFGPQDLHEFCGTLVPGPLTVTLAAGAQATGGASLAPGSWSLDTKTLPVVASGCIGYLVAL